MSRANPQSNAAGREPPGRDGGEALPAPPRRQPPLYVSDSRATGHQAGRFVRLMRALVVREWKATYRRSVLGFGWAFLQPFMYLVVFTGLRGILKIPSDGLPYPLFTLAALVPWSFFSNVLNRSAPSVLGNAGIVKKMDVPREVFPVAAAVSALRDFLIALVILAGFTAWFGWQGRVPDFSWRTLAWLPVFVLMLTLFGLALGMIAAAIGTYRRDILFALPLVMQFWMLASPVVYPRSQVPEAWRGLYDLNPLSPLLEGFRGALLQGLAPDPAALVFPLVVLGLLCAGSLALYRHMSKYFADVL